MWHAASERRLSRRGRGLTLLETLVTTALFSIVIAGVYLMYTTMQETLTRGEVKSELQQNARVGLDRMVQEIRMAGYNASGAAVAELPLRGATGTCLSLVTANPSGGAAVQVTYSITQNADGTFTLRRDEGGGAQPLAESVSSLAFTYSDAFNQPITPASVTSAPCVSNAGLTAAQIRQVRRVGITLKTGRPVSGASPEFYTLTADVRLRNR